MAAVRNVGTRLPVFGDKREERRGCSKKDVKFPWYLDLEFHPFLGDGRMRKG